jgi:hypothetical protein
MAISGDLDTMPLVELLQWAGGHRKTGVLELERNKVSKRIAFRDGRIVGCASDDPSKLLGRFLISRGKIGARTLRFAMSEHQRQGRPLPDILVEMGVITRQELAAQVAVKAFETVYGLFEWADAVFRFQTDGVLDGNPIEVDLSVEEILLEGAERHDEVQRIRGILTSSGIVLRRTDRSLPPDLEGGALAFEVLELIGGERTLAEILLKAHASEFDVLKLLFTLHAGGCVEVAEERAVDESSRTLLDVDHGGAPAELPSLAEISAADEPGQLGDAGEMEPAEGPEHAMEPADLHVLLNVASRRMGLGDHEGALTVLDACYRARPEEESVKRMIAEAESAYLRQLRCELLPPDRVPVRAVSDEALSALELQPAESTLLGMIDGEANVRSILWTLPLREVQGMRTLEKLYARGLVRLEEPETVDGAASEPVTTDPAEDEDLVEGFDLLGAPGDDDGQPAGCD